MQKLILLSFSLFAIILASGCDDDNHADPEPRPTERSFADIDAVTGIGLRDENGNTLGFWGSPNHKPGNASAFPNPSTGQVAFYRNSSFKDIWLVPAECLVDTMTSDIPGMSSALSFTTEQVDSFKVRKLSFGNNTAQVLLDFSDVSAGFYRLFYTDDNGAVFWLNLFIDPEASGFPSFAILDDYCQ